MLFLFKRAWLLKWFMADELPDELPDCGFSNFKGDLQKTEDYYLNFENDVYNIFPTRIAELNLLLQDHEPLELQRDHLQGWLELLDLEYRTVRKQWVMQRINWNEFIGFINVIYQDKERFSESLFALETEVGELYHLNQ